MTNPSGEFEGVGRSIEFPEMALTPESQVPAGLASLIEGRKPESGRELTTSLEVKKLLVRGEGYLRSRSASWIREAENPFDCVCRSRNRERPDRKSGPGDSGRAGEEPQPGC